MAPLSCSSAYQLLYFEPTNTCELCELKSLHILVVGGLVCRSACLPSWCSARVLLFLPSVPFFVLFCVRGMKGPAEAAEILGA